MDQTSQTSEFKDYNSAQVWVQNMVGWLNTTTLVTTMDTETDLLPYICGNDLQLGFMDFLSTTFYKDQCNINRLLDEHWRHRWKDQCFLLIGWNTC